MARPVLHVVALAHLDTQWRWTARETAERHLPDTVRRNDALFDRHPRYVLSFEGSWRYRLLAEHHPELFARVRARVAEGRWSPAGAAVEAFDTLLPAPESILRQILYGRRWFVRELGVDSRDLFLPDCFGFPSTLPTLARHAGIEGFSTQKLRRGALMRSAFGIPFPYGRWRGRDGAELLAALDPGEYSGRIEGELERDAAWLERFAAVAAAGGGGRLLLYVGTGDRGGAPPETTIAALGRALAAAGPIDVRHGGSAAIYAETTADERSSLPVYDGELLLRLHGTGCYTAKGNLKRWNELGERWARAAEAACALALGAGARPPLARLGDAWQHLLAHQMHDDLTGTSIPAAYEISFAEVGFAVNEFAEIARRAVGAAAATLAPGGAGSALAILDSLGVAREELVEVAMAGAAEAAGALSPEGEPVPVQPATAADGSACLLLPVRTKGLELSTWRLTAAPSAPAGGDRLVVAEDRLENDRFAARFDAQGRLTSLLDRRLGRELLAAPLELELLPNRSRKYPAWEIHWRDAASAPLARFHELLKLQVLESGPLRAALRIERATGRSVVRETWRLAAGGTGDLLTCEVELDWRSRGRLLKLRFPFAAANPEAAYDTGLGAVRRGLASAALYEVPAQKWAAIEDAGGAWGAAVLAEARHGWDHPDPATLRLTLAHSPFAGNKFRHQTTQDFGRQRFRFALLGFAPGAIDDGTLAARADRWSHPPIAYRVEGGDASPAQSRRRNLVTVAPPARLLALKPAEEAPEALVARLQNPAAAPIAAGLESTEHRRGIELDATEHPSELPSATSLGEIPPGGLRTFRLEPLRPLASSPVPDCLALDLHGDLAGFGRRGEREREGFDGAGRRFPSTALPDFLDCGPARFALRANGDSLPLVARSSGQRLEIDGEWDELWLLGASIDGDREARFAMGEIERRAPVSDWRAPFLRESRWRRQGFRKVLDPGRFRRAATAWSAAPLLGGDGGPLSLERGALFALRIPLAGARRVGLPDDRLLRWVAATLVRAAGVEATDAYPPLLP